MTSITTSGWGIEYGEPPPLVAGEIVTFEGCYVWEPLHSIRAFFRRLFVRPDPRPLKQFQIGPGVTSTCVTIATPDLPWWCR